MSGCDDLADRFVAGYHSRTRRFPALVGMEVGSAQPRARDPYYRVGGVLDGRVRDVRADFDTAGTLKKEASHTNEANAERPDANPGTT